MTYPLPNYRFFVTLDPTDAYVPPTDPGQLARLAVGAFSDVTGLTGDLEVLPQPEGGRNDFVHQLPVRHSWGRIVLKRGVTADTALWDWYRQGLDGNLGARRDGAVVLLDLEGRPAVTWEFHGGLAAKWTGPDLVARDGAVALETLEIAHEGVRQVTTLAPTAPTVPGLPAVPGI